MKASKYLEIMFPVGTKVKVLADYYEVPCPHRETQTAVVVEHYVNDNTCDDPFIDNYLKFEDGTIEPFANWEITKEEN